MKVLIAHNRYRSDSPSGENDVVDAEVALLEAAGVEVDVLLRESDSIRGSARTQLEAALGSVYAPAGVRAFTRQARTFRPDVVHIHNVFPLLSPNIVRVARQEGIPIVQTVHNYRHSCVNGLHFRAGVPCTDCLGRVPLPAVLHGCYRGSRTQSLAMAAGQALHRSTWRDVDLYFALTPFMSDILEKTGVDQSRIIIRPSWTEDPGLTHELGDGFLFVGRLDAAKGIMILLDAWAARAPGTTGSLTIVGDGPLVDLVRRRAKVDPSVRYLGRLSRPAVISALSAAAVVVVPSVWFEGFPLVVAEAFSLGRPVVTMAGGSVGSIVDESCGWLVPTASHQALRDVMMSVTPRQAKVRGRNARGRFESQNSPQAALASLLAGYTKVIGK